QAFAKANSEAEKLLWERLVNDLKKIDLTQLPYNHPLYSGIFDIESSPISDLPDSLCNVFEENTKKKFCIDNNEALLQTCKEVSREVESYNEAIIGSITVINEGSYVSEVLAPLFNIALRDLPTKQNMKNLKGNSCSACRPDLMLIAFVNDQRVDILNLETGCPDSSK
ncbi:8495_t:CDS:2, partial [Entrophospora sp. SA101]